MLSRHKISAIIPAGGIGSRMNLKIPKQFIEICGKPVIAYTVEALSKCKQIDEIIVAVPDGYIAYFNDIVNEFKLSKVSKILCGGPSRQETVYKCLVEDTESDLILIHDAVRPFISPKTLKAAIDAAVKYGAAAVGVPAVDTLKMSDEVGFIKNTVDRKNIWQIQTPQIFKTDVIKSAHEKAHIGGVEATDDCALAEMYGQKIKLVKSESLNLKITYESDLKIMEAYFNEF